MAMPKGSFGSRKARRTGEGRGNRPAARAGRETGKGFRPQPRPETGRDEEAFGLRERLRESGKAFGRRRDPKRGFRRASASRISSKDGTASADRLSKGRPERLRPRCEPSETARLRPGPIRAGKRWRDFGPARAARSGSARGFMPLSDTHRVPNGASASLRDPEESEAGVRARLAIRSRPARDGLATQRRQSKLGQVGAGGDTGPHYDSRTGYRPPSLGPRPLFSHEDHEGAKGLRRRSRPGRSPGLQ